MLIPDLEHDPEHGHIVGVARVAQLVEDGVLEDGGEVVGVRGAQLLQAAQEQVHGLLRLKPLLDELHHHLQQPITSQYSLGSDQSEASITSTSTLVAVVQFRQMLLSNS